MQRFRKILAQVNSGSGGTHVFRRAIRTALAFKARLTLLGVVAELPVYLRQPAYGYPALSDTLVSEQRTRLEALASEARQAGVETDIAALYGKEFLEIVRQVLRGGHDLLITAADEEGMKTLSSTTAMRLFRTCPCPVWAVRPDGADPYHRILATVDPQSGYDEEDALNRSIVEAALSLQEVEGGEIDVLHVWGGGVESVEMLAPHSEKMQQSADKALRAFLDPYKNRLDATRVHLLQGDPARVIRDFARRHETDLIVMGTLVRTGVAGLVIGNTAEEVLAEIECSVFALKPAGFRSPVELD